MLLLVDEDTQYRINVFDWEKAYPETMKRGGFDCVIGNRPYLSVDDVRGKRDPKLSYLKSEYPEVYNDKTDLLFYFLALALRISKRECGMIVSRTFLESFKADKLRETITKRSTVRKIIDFRDYRVFRAVGIATAIILLSKPSELEDTVAAHYIGTGGVPDLKRLPQDSFNIFCRSLKGVGAKPWSFGRNSFLELFARTDSLGQPLGSVMHLGQGMQTGANSVFGKKTPGDIARLKVPRRCVRRRAANSDISRYWLRDRGEMLIYVEEAAAFCDLPEALQEYLESESEKLKSRAAYVRGDCEWWKFTWPLHKEHGSRSPSDLRINELGEGLSSNMTFCRRG